MSADPYLGAGTSADPASWNRFAYVLEDPINLYDPNGLDPITAGYDLPSGASFNPNDPRNVIPGGTSVTVYGGPSGPSTSFQEFLRHSQQLYNMPLGGGGNLGNSYALGYAEMLGRQISGEMSSQNTVLHPVGNSDGTTAATTPAICGDFYCKEGSTTEPDLSRALPVEMISVEDTGANIAIGTTLVLVGRIGGRVSVGSGDYLFARRTGFLNSNPYVRIGWGWSQPVQSEVFRISIGGRGMPIWRHFDLWKR